MTPNLSREQVEELLEEQRFIANKGHEIDVKKIINLHPDFHNFWDAESINWDKRFLQG